jgi:hypothetical protein
MAGTVTDPAPLSKSARRRRRKRESGDPLFQALRDLLGGDSQATETVRVLKDYGITTPEELRRAPLTELAEIPGLSSKKRLRVTQLRQRLAVAALGLNSNQGTDEQNADDPTRSEE